MRKIYKYKGYITVIHYDDRDNMYFGKIENIDDLVLFEGKNRRNFKKDFHGAVKDYIEFCKRNNKNDCVKIKE